VIDWIDWLLAGRVQGVAGRRGPWRHIWRRRWRQCLRRMLRRWSALRM